MMHFMDEQEAARAWAESVPIEECEPLTGADAAHLGAVKVRPHGPDHIESWILVRPGLNAQDRAGFIEWARQRMTMYSHIGPEADGWDPSPDGGWHLTCRQLDGPADPFA